MWSDCLSIEEAEFTQKAIDALRPVHWTQPLLRDVQTNGGLTMANMSRLFEVRFALELYRLGLSVEYEYCTGVGNSSVDFRVLAEQEWLIELVSLRETHAVKAATQTVGRTQGGEIRKLELSSSAKDQKQSEAGQMLVVQQKIAQKMVRDDQPTKFLEPAGALHMIFVDTRGYLGSTPGNSDDWAQMTLGPRHCQPEFVQRWNDRPITGLFQSETSLRGAELVRRRIHFIGFVCEEDYTEGELREKARYVANPHLFADKDEARAAFMTCPVRPERGRRSGT